MKYSVKLDGKQYEVEVERIEDDFRALTKAEAVGTLTQAPKQISTSEVVKPEKNVATAPAAEKPAASAVKSSAGCTVVSPMPGTVLEVKAAVGQSMKAGEIIIVIEAMKMENEIVSPQDGVIDAIPVKKGDAIDTDAVLAVLK